MSDEGFRLEDQGAVRPESDPASRAELAAAVDALPAALIGDLVRQGQFCAAARLYSEVTGADLVESKLAIDRIARRHGLAPIHGCASYFALMLLCGGALVWGTWWWIG